MGASVVAEGPAQVKSREEKRRFSLPVALAVVFLSLGLLLAIGPVTNGLRQARHNAWMQQGRQIGQCMFYYSADNAGGGNAYPDGNNSTEVFQKLLDAGYVTDPNIFFVPMPGKVAPEPGQKKLKPENVSWDVTVPVDSNSSGLVPLVYMTGYKVNFVAGGSAVRLSPGLGFGLRDRTWREWLFDWSSGPKYIPAQGTAVFYKGNNAIFLMFSMKADGTIPNFVSPDFKPDGHIYRQLTPEGVLQ